VFPDFSGPWLSIKAHIRILILTDDDGSYTEAHRFGLTELVTTLETTPGVFAKITVTKAHRDTATPMYDEPANADIQTFRFDDPNQFNPANYDQIWLIGIRERISGQVLSQAELKVIAQFMDQGGGVFATGDHQDLGGALSGEIPRVRSMRKWTYNYSHDYETYNPNSAEGPPVLGSFRHDTLVAGHNPTVSFDDQSDDIPAEIHPKFYGPQNKYFSIRYPHPILCAPGGVISVLPDHMHEGECIVPSDVTQSYTFNGYTSTEYPVGSIGQIIPDVIALGEVFAHVTDNTGEGSIVDVASKAKKFGVIGAYDGHLANVGRVVVDSTFHHFVNINVIASEANSPDADKQIGFAYSAAGEDAYDQIRAYWRNIAIWLARSSQQQAMFYRTLWAARWDSQLRMVLPGMARRENISWDEMVQYGGTVRATLGRLVSPCASFNWLFAEENPLAKFSWWVKKNLPDPPPWEVSAVFINPEEYMLGTLGAIMMELIRAAPIREAEFRDNLDERMPTVIRSGFAVARKTALPHYERRIRETEEMIESIRAAGEQR
jgi:hypothetical protein